MYKRTIKRYNKRKPPAKKPALPFRYKVADTAYSAWKMANKIRKLVNTEQKAYDSGNTSTSSYNGTILPIALMAQGTTDNQRVGDSVLNKSIFIRGTVQRNTTDSSVRFILFRDKQNTIASTADLMNNTGSTYSPFEPFHKDNKKQFTILLDKTFVVDTYHPKTDYKFEFKNLDTHSQFDNGGTTINTGGYKIALISDTVAGPSVLTMSRLFYIDN